MTRKIAARFAIVVFMFLIAPSIMKAALFHKVLRGDISVRDPKLVDVNGDGKADLIGLGPRSLVEQRRRHVPAGPDFWLGRRGSSVECGR